MPRKQIKLSVDESLYNRLLKASAIHKLAISSYIRALVVKSLDNNDSKSDKTDDNKEDGLVFLNDVLAPEDNNQNPQTTKNTTHTLEDKLKNITINININS